MGSTDMATLGCFISRVLFCVRTWFGPVWRFVRSLCGGLCSPCVAVCARPVWRASCCRAVCVALRACASLHLDLLRLGLVLQSLAACVFVENDSLLVHGQFLPVPLGRKSNACVCSSRWLLMDLMI